MNTEQLDNMIKTSDANESVVSAGSAELAQVLMENLETMSVATLISGVCHALTRMDGSDRRAAMALMRLAGNDWPAAVEIGIERAINAAVPF